MNTPLPELRPIPIAPNDDYMAGADGQIYSRTKYAGPGKKLRVPWYPLKGYIQNRGYVTITMCHEGRRVTQTVHRLVCMAFHGMPPNREKGSRMETRHIDGNRQNNVPSNLCWGTPAENWHDKRIHRTATVGEKHPAAKFTDVEREHIRWAISKGLCSQKQAARALHVAQSSIQGIVKSSVRSSG